MVKILKAVSEKRPEINTIVLDDIGHIMVKEAFARIKEGGYEKFTDIGKHMYEIFNTVDHLRDDLFVVFMFHQKTELVDGYIPQVKIKTIGKILDSWFNPEESFDVLMYTDVEFGQDGQANYGFITNKTAEYPAKSPQGMFDIRIPNDLNLVINQIQEYYNG